MAEVIACQVVVLDGSIVSIDVNVSDRQRRRGVGTAHGAGHALLEHGLAA